MDEVAGNGVSAFELVGMLHNNRRDRDQERRTDAIRAWFKAAQALGGVRVWLDVGPEDSTVAFQFGGAVPPPLLTPAAP
jgi:hypothetical protein